MSIGSITKQPAERYPVALDYARRLPTGATLVSGTASALDLADGSDASATVLDTTTCTVSDDTLLVPLTGGADGDNYQITVLATLSTGSPAHVLEDDFTLHVRAQ